MHRFWEVVEIDYLIRRLVMDPATNFNVVLQSEVKADEGLEDHVANGFAQMSAWQSHYEN